MAPFAFEKTKMTMPESLMSDNVIVRGILREELAARNLGFVNEGVR